MIPIILNRGRTFSPWTFRPATVDIVDISPFLEDGVCCFFAHVARMLWIIVLKIHFIFDPVISIKCYYLLCRVARFIAAKLTSSNDRLNTDYRRQMNSFRAFRTHIFINWTLVQLYNSTDFLYYIGARIGATRRIRWTDLCIGGDADGYSRPNWHLFHNYWYQQFELLILLIANKCEIGLP